MNSYVSKSSKQFIFTVLIISIFASAIGNFVTDKNIIGGIIVVFILVFIPFLIEIIRKNDPVKYYGLNLEKLRSINLKFIFITATSIFTVISVIDYAVFDLWNLILNSKQNMDVGSVSIALAKTNYFYLGIIVVFSGTLLEELWFRGIVQHKISRIKALKKINPHFAIIVQSILFGLIHFVPMYYGTTFSMVIKIWFFVYPAVIGLIIGYINDKYRSLWPGWIIHYTNNLLSIILLAILYSL